MYRHRRRSVAAHSIRSRILKAVQGERGVVIGARRSPFDPFEDTESSAVTRSTLRSTVGRSPFDPFEDTEREDYRLSESDEKASQPIRSVRGY